MIKYHRISRQFIALAAGTLVAVPFALVGALLTPADPDAPSMNIGSASHTAYGPFLFLLIATLRFLSFAATVLNYLAVVIAGVVALSLVYDAVKLKHWRTSKFFALLGQTAVSFGVWYGTALAAGEPAILAMTPFLSSIAGVFVACVTLVILRSLGRSAEAHA